MRIRWLPMSETLVRSANELRGLAMVRALLVVAIVAFGSAAVSRSFIFIYSTPLWIIPAIAPSALFALSGFTLAQSLSDETRRAWLLRRLRRGWPAVIAAVLLAVLVIGPISNTRRLDDYFTDPETASYLLNLFGIPEFTLPGVFEFNDLADMVNPLMWMVPVFAILALVLAGPPARFRRIMWGGLAALVTIGGFIASIAGIEPAGGTSPLTYVAPMTGALLCGLLGAMASDLRAFVPHDGRAAVLAAGIIGVAALLASRFAALSLAFHVALALPVAYAALYATLRRSRGPALWGQVQPYLAPMLFLAFPIQQMAAEFGPRNQSVLVNLLLSVPPLLVATILCGWVFQRPRIAVAPREHAWTEVSGPGTVPRRRRRREPLGDRLRSLMLPIITGLIIIVLALGVMALTFYALQRETVGL